MTGRAQAIIEEMVPPLLTPLTGGLGEDGKPVVNLAALLDMLDRMQQRQDQQDAIIDALTSALNSKAAAAALATLSQRVTTLMQTVDSKAATAYVDQQLQAIGNIDADQAAAIQQVQQALSGDEGVLQTLLAKATTHDNLLTGLRMDVDAKAPQTTVSSLSGQLTTLRNAVNDTGSGLAATKAVADAALPKAGGTMTGPLNVLAPTSAPNPLQMSSLPYSTTLQQALPLIALGGIYSFTVAVPNARVGMVAALSVPAALLTAGTLYGAAVTADDTVTITLKAGVAIAAGTQTFYLRVLR